VKAKGSITAILVILCGCALAQVNVEVLSERTTLENQILGTYNSLDREMMLLASVRGVDPTGQIRKPPNQSQEHRDAISAIQLQTFHLDDLSAFKRLQWVGENNAGFLKPFPMNKENVPDELDDFAKRYTEQEFNAVITQINAARIVIMQRVIDLNENLAQEDLPKVQQIFGALNAENALVGEKIQTKDGTWMVKK
jgi:uncharacterized protein YdbL (DUF1318 family)